MRRLALMASADPAITLQYCHDLVFSPIDQDRLVCSCGVEPEGFRSPTFSLDRYLVILGFGNLFDSRPVHLRGQFTTRHFVRVQFLDFAMSWIRDHTGLTGGF